MTKDESTAYKLLGAGVFLILAFVLFFIQSAITMAVFWALNNWVSDSIPAYGYLASMTITLALNFFSAIIFRVRN